MTTFVNVTVPFSHNGHHYEGMALVGSVHFAIVDRPETGRKEFVILGAGPDVPRVIAWDAVSAIDPTPSGYVPGYLKIKPVV